MSGDNNYPSCIKVPPSHSKQGSTAAVMKDIEAIIATNYELICVANRIFGTAKWSHSITSQTLDYVESLLGKFTCGCVSFVKIQLDDGIFHEDMGYFCSEAPTKALAIQAARLGSLSNGFEKTLVCFGTTVEQEVKRVLKSLQKPVIVSIPEESKCFLNSLADEQLAPCAQSTPYIGKKDTTVTIAKHKSATRINQATTESIIPRSKSPNSTNEQTTHRSISRSKSPIDRREHRAPASPFNGESKNHLKTEATFDNQSEKKQKDQENQSNMEREEEKRVISEEELLRQERRRKQMEKQAEYKRLLKEKELQKANENKKPNPKY